jgi:hypothetical protein
MLCEKCVPLAVAIRRRSSMKLRITLTRFASVPAGFCSRLATTTWAASEAMRLAERAWLFDGLLSFIDHSIDERA